MKTLISTILLCASIAVPALCQTPNPDFETFSTTELANRTALAAFIQGGPFPKPPALGVQLIGLFNLYAGYQQLSGGAALFSLDEIKAEVDMAVASRANAYYGLGTVAVPGGSSGTAYMMGDLVTVVQGNAFGGTLNVTGVSAGAITNVTINTQGQSYSIANGVSLTGGSGTSGTINITALSVPPGLGATILEINLDPFCFVDNTSFCQSVRTLFDNVVTYISSTYPNVKLNFNPSFASDNLGAASDGSGLYGCASAAFTSGSATTINTTQDLAKCVTLAHTSATVPAGWLPIGGINYSAYGYLSKKYAAIINRFAGLHEPTTNNANTNYHGFISGLNTVTVNTAGTGYSVNDVLTLVQGGNTSGQITVDSPLGGGGSITHFHISTNGANYTLPATGLSATGGSGINAKFNITVLGSTEGAGAGSAANWQSFLGTVNTEISNYSSAKLCVAFSRFEQSWQATVVAASPAPTCVGYDSYTDNINSTNNDLGNIDAMINAAQTSGFEVYVSELGPPSWVNYGQVQTDANSWWGIGNCNWLGTDLFRQYYALNSLYFAWKGVTEINYFTVLAPSTYCVTTMPLQTGADRYTNLTTYAVNLAANSVAWPVVTTHAIGSSFRTGFFQQFYNLFGWPFGQVGGGPLSPGNGQIP